jgi:hypothetical protein
MFRTVLRLLVVLALLVTLAIACGTGPQPNPGTNVTDHASAPVSTTTPSDVVVAPTASATPMAATRTDIEKVAQKIFFGNHPMGQCLPGCSALTPRLAARIAVVTSPNPNGPGSGDPFCRCQNGPSSILIVGEPTGSGGIAHVRLYYSATLSVLIDLIELRQDDGELLVDDLRCTGRGPETSIYAANPGGCEVR